jgi:hypothetical protein
MNLLKQHQMNLFTTNMSTIGELELLRIYYESVQQRSAGELVEYTNLIRSGEIFTKDVLILAIDIAQFLGPGYTVQQKVIDWMVNYTNDAASALSMAHVAKRVSKYIYDQVDHYWNGKKNYRSERGKVRTRNRYQSPIQKEKRNTIRRIITSCIKKYSLFAFI